MAALSSQNEAHNQQYLNFISPDFIGRRNEIRFFVENFLQTDFPLYRIMSISGASGMGKTRLLRQLSNLIQEIPEFKDTCLTAFVNEQQSDPANVMKAIADQLSNSGHRLKRFEQEWSSYLEVYEKDEALRQDESTTSTETWGKIAGIAAEGLTDIGIGAQILPIGTDKIVEPIVENTATLFTQKLGEHAEKQRINRKHAPVVELTKVFISDLSAVLHPSTLFMHREKKTYKLLLFFDTFSRTAPTIASWLLDIFLPNLEQNVALVIAGRRPPAAYTPEGYQQWQPYLDTNMPNSFLLKNFNKDETTIYLKFFGITNSAKIQSFWTQSFGDPYYLFLLRFYHTSDNIDPHENIVANILPKGKENENKRRLALEGSLLSKTFNRDELAALPIMQGRNDIELYDWLVEQPFIRQNRYNEHAQTLFSLFLRDESPDEYNKTRKALIENYQQQLEQLVGLDAYISQYWLPLVLALVAELLLLQTPDEAYRCNAIKFIIDAYIHANHKQEPEIFRALHHLSRTEDNPADERSRLIAEKLLICIEKDLDSKEFLEANTYLLQRVALQPTFPREVLAIFYLQRGQAFSKIHNYKQAIQDFNTSITINNNDPLEYGNRGNTYRLSGEFELANNDFTEAIARDPNYLWAYKQRAFTYKSLGQFDNAIDDLNTYISHTNQSSWWAYGQRGKIYRLLKNYPRAMQDLNKAIKLNQQNSWAYAQRGLVHLWQKELDLAKLDYLHCQEIDIKNINYLSLVVWIDMLQQRDDAKAIQQLETQLPPDAPAYLILVGQGMAAWLHQDFNQAQTKLQQAIDQEPHRWNARFWHAMALLSTNQDEKAIEEITQTLQLGMPPILLTPLQWFQQSRAEFYAKTLAPIIQQADG
jgi:tetratricopeptide (TPR) repeat protein